MDKDLAGENWVVNYERNFLSENGHNELADRVSRISHTSIWAGYDVLSYELNSYEKYIEVKTTALSKLEFFLSANELEVAKEMKSRYWIYFLSEIYGIPKLVRIQNPSAVVDTRFFLTATNYRVQLLNLEE